MIIRTIFTILSSVKTADRGLIGRLSLVALPIMLQNLLTSSLSFLDTLMIGQLGQQEIAAVGIANQVYFVISLLFFGIASGTSIYLAQYYGAREYGKMRKAMSFATMLCLAGGAIVSILSFIFSDAIIRIFSAEQAVIDAGSTYLRYVAFSYMFSAVSATLSIGFRSVSQEARSPRSSPALRRCSSWRCWHGEGMNPSPSPLGKTSAGTGHSSNHLPSRPFPWC